MNTKSDLYNVPGLEKGLAILELLSRRDSWLTLQDITREVDVTPTTAYRIISTLLRMDYIMCNEKEKSYRTTRKMLRLGYQTIGEHDIIERVLPYIRFLRDIVKESVFFGVLGEEKGVFIEQAQSIHPFKFVLSPGSSFDLHNSAPGKAILAFTSNSIRDTYINKIEFTKCTNNTITTRSAYVKELEKVKKEGYATDLEETLLGVTCIGAPVFNFEGMPLGAIWISWPNSRMSDEIFNFIKEQLLESTTRLSKELGYQTKQGEL